MMAEDFDLILDECVNRINQGDSLEACLNDYPSYAARLKPLLQSMCDIQEVYTFTPSVEAKRIARQKFYEVLDKRQEMTPVSELIRLISRPAIWITVAVLILVIIGTTVIRPALSPPTLVSGPNEEPVVIDKEKSVAIDKEEPIVVDKEEPVVVDEEESEVVDEEESEVVDEEESEVVDEEEPVVVDKKVPVVVDKEESVVLDKEEPVVLDKEEPTPQELEINLIPDEHLRKSMRYNLRMPQDEYIKADDLAKLSVVVAGGNVSDLTGIEHCVNVEILSLSNNQINDLPNLSTLYFLTELRLDHNQISDISALSSLERLQVLVLDYNEISDLSSLASLTNLKELRIENNKISDISPLVMNSGLGEGDKVFLFNNNLELSDGSQFIRNVQQLRARGVWVMY